MVRAIRRRWPECSYVHPDGATSSNRRHGKQPRRGSERPPQDTYVEADGYLIPREVRMHYYGGPGWPDIELVVISDETGASEITELHITSGQGAISDNFRIAGIDGRDLMIATLAASAYGAIGDNTYAGISSEDVAYSVQKLRQSRRRKRKLTKEFLTDVARVYREAASAGDAPVKAVAEHWGMDPSKPYTARGWVMEARKLGLLPPTSPGKVSS